MEKKLPIEEVRNLFCTPDIITMIKSKWTILVGHVALTGELSNAYEILVWKPEEKAFTYLGGQCLNGA
jgi:hypothetical protein